MGGREDLGTRLLKVCFGAHKEMACGYLLFSKWWFMSCREGKTKKFVMRVFKLNFSWPGDFYVVNRVKKMRPETIFSLFLAFFLSVMKLQNAPPSDRKQKQKRKRRELKKEKEKNGAGMHQTTILMISNVHLTHKKPIAPRQHTIQISSR